MEELKFKLSEFGFIKIFKAGTVFTLLMTGNSLSNSSVVGAIMDLVTKEFGVKYPILEAMSNDKYYFLIVLAPKK